MSTLELLIAEEDAQLSNVKITTIQGGSTLSFLFYYSGSLLRCIAQELNQVINGRKTIACSFRFRNIIVNSFKIPRTWFHWLFLESLVRSNTRHYRTYTRPLHNPFLKTEIQKFTSLK